MKNSSIFRANLSGEKVAFLSELKNQNESEQEDSNAPKTYKRPSKQKEIDLLWQHFKINPKEEKSPGIYLLTGFIAGALSMFIMNAIISISSNITSEPTSTSFGQPKFEKKISRKSKLPQINTPDIELIPAVEEKVTPVAEPQAKFETYIVKSGDSMSSIVYRFYGKYDPDKIEKIKQVNNLSSVHRLSIGQELTIPVE